MPVNLAKAVKIVRDVMSERLDAYLYHGTAGDAIRLEAQLAICKTIIANLREIEKEDLEEED